MHEKNGLINNYRHFVKCSEKGNIGQASYCLSKAIMADPKDVTLRLHRASLHVELGDYQKAAESYEQIYQLTHDNIEALKTGAKVLPFSLFIKTLMNLI
jgi:Tfp pilus assembly protein PilF